MLIWKILIGGMKSTACESNNSMTSHLTSRLTWRIGSFLFGALALLSLAAALFFFISDDFVIRGQVVPATDARFVPWRVGLSVAGALCIALAWLCHRPSHRGSHRENLNN